MEFTNAADFKKDTGLQLKDLVGMWFSFFGNQAEVVIHSIEF